MCAQALTFHVWFFCVISTLKSKVVKKTETGLPAVHDIEVSLAVLLTLGTPGGCILTGRTHTRTRTHMQKEKHFFEIHHFQFNCISCIFFVIKCFRRPPEHVFLGWCRILSWLFQHSLAMSEKLWPTSCITRFVKNFSGATNKITVYLGQKSKPLTVIAWRIVREDRHQRPITLHADVGHVFKRVEFLEGCIT